jgi:hypothetical protein
LTGDSPDEYLQVNATFGDLLERGCKENPTAKKYYENFNAATEKKALQKWERSFRNSQDEKCFDKFVMIAVEQGSLANFVILGLVKHVQGLDDLVPSALAAKAKFERLENLKVRLAAHTAHRRE